LAGFEGVGRLAFGCSFLFFDYYKLIVIYVVTIIGYISIAEKPFSISVNIKR